MDWHTSRTDDVKGEAIIDALELYGELERVLDASDNPRLLLRELTRFPRPVPKLPPPSISIPTTKSFSSELAVETEQMLVLLEVRGRNESPTATSLPEVPTLPIFASADRLFFRHDVGGARQVALG